MWDMNITNGIIQTANMPDMDDQTQLDFYNLYDYYSDKAGLPMFSKDGVWSYDYHVVGERDISDLDDKDFVRLRRKKNKIVLLMYSIVLIMFVASMGVLSKFLIFFFN